MARTRNRLEITPDILLRAYSIGLFPMAENATDPSLFWVDPEERGIFPLDRLVISRSLAKVVRSDGFQIRVDSDFQAIIDGCAESAPGREGTWINARIRDLYGALFQSGHVHTIEVWKNDALVGGLYGVAIGAAFFGESMFHRVTDASKVALVHLAARLVHGGFVLLDTQFVTDHLATLGAIAIPKQAYHLLLADAVARRADFWRLPRSETMSGADALDILRAHARPE